MGLTKIFGVNPRPSTALSPSIARDLLCQYSFKILRSWYCLNSSKVMLVVGL